MISRHTELRYVYPIQEDDEARYTRYRGSLNAVTSSGVQGPQPAMIVPSNRRGRII